jgi:GNAT superfamily N-acetyltransferase
MARLEVVPFADEHLAAAAALLAARHARQREAEPLLPETRDFAAELEREWRVEGASGAFASRGGKAVAYLIAAPKTIPGGLSWMLAGVAGLAIEGDAEPIRDVYAAAAQRWVDEGELRHAAFVPVSDPELVDAWFRLSFGASSVLAARATGPEAEEPFDGNVEIRRGTPDDYDETARLEIAMSAAMQPGPSFSSIPLQTPEEVVAEWREDPDIDQYELFVAERGGRIVGHFLLYRRPPDLRVPDGSIDLAQASTEAEARGTGVGRALTAHVLGWANENGYPVMTTDWRMTNLWASRFWPKRGFRPSFLRVYRALP